MQQMGTSPVFAGEEFVSLVTFRRSGEPVGTPVWFAEEGDSIYIYTQRSSGKAKRIRNNPEVLVAACSRVGEVHGPWQRGFAGILAGEREAHGLSLLKAKYPMLEQVARAMGGGAAGDPVILRVMLQGPLQPA